MSNTKFSPKKYILEKGRKLPIEGCYVADAYSDMGLTSCLIVRKQPSGKYTMALFLIDRYCLGVKQAMVNCNLDELEISELKEKAAQVGQLKVVDEHYFHNLVYASIDFAEENGFSPPKDFPIAERVLDPDLIDDGIDDTELGKNCVPVFINGPFDDVQKITHILNKNVGHGNYEVVLMQ